MVPQIYGGGQIARSALGGKGGKKTHDPLAPGNTGTWRRDVDTAVGYGHGWLSEALGSVCTGHIRICTGSRI
jgi:hypothetical protein